MLLVLCLGMVLVCERVSLPNPHPRTTKLVRLLAQPIPFLMTHLLRARAHLVCARARAQHVHAYASGATFSSGTFWCKSCLT